MHKNRVILTEKTLNFSLKRTQPSLDPYQTWTGHPTRRPSPLCPRLILAAPLTDVVMFTLFLRLWSILFTLATRILLSVFPSPQHYCVYRYPRRFITYSDVAVSLMIETHARAHTHVSRDLSPEEQNSLWRLMLLLLAWRTPDAVTSHDEDQPWIAGSNRDGIDNDLRAICSTSDPRRHVLLSVRPSVRHLTY